MNFKLTFAFTLSFWFSLSPSRSLLFFSFYIKVMCWFGISTFLVFGLTRENIKIWWKAYKYLLETIKKLPCSRRYQQEEDDLGALSDSGGYRSSGRTKTVL